MIYIFITFLILLLFTINPKYLGKFKFLALQNVLSKSTTQTIQHGLFLVFILWLLYCLFEKEIQSYFQLNTKENFTEEKLDQTNEMANKDVDSKPVTPDDLPKIPSKQDKSSSDEFRAVQPSIVQGLDPKTVVGSPVYYEPGTIMYNGLGYSPSYSEMIYLNNHVFKSEPKKVVEANVKGFCDQSDNIMNNINEKCNALPSDVCASTECCVLFGGEKCVEGDENGPKNKAVYSDTSIKNRDVYYYQGDCYGNCQKGPRYVPPKQPETKPKPPTPEMISPAPSPAMISPAPDSAIITPTPSPEMISPAPDSAILNPSPSQAEIQPVPNQNAQDLPKKLAPTPPQTGQPQLLPEIPTQTMSIPGQNTETLPNTNSIANTAEQDLNSMIQSLE